MTGFLEASSLFLAASRSSLNFVMFPELIGVVPRDCQNIHIIIPLSGRRIFPNNLLPVCATVSPSFTFMGTLVDGKSLRSEEDTPSLVADRLGILTKKYFEPKNMDYFLLCEKQTNKQ